jgi:hypothetical protein
MGSLMYLRIPFPIDELAVLLELSAPQIRTALDRCRSILIIPDQDIETIRPYHASLQDFLTDHHRAQGLWCAPANCHALLAVQCLKAITNAYRSGLHPPRYDSIAWLHHATSLLSATSDRGELQSLLSTFEVGMKEIDLKWVEYWMSEALVVASFNDVMGDLPLSGVRFQDM